jgi:gliding motility-associated-like protein
LKDFSIYNRWGGVVFRTKNINEGWNGNINKQPAPAGAYVYSISGTDQRKKVVVKGTILLLR